MEFMKGETDPVGDCGNFGAGIDVHGADQFPHDSKKRTWYSRVECYGYTSEQAQELRDKVLALLVTTEHDGELHKAVFMALEAYGGTDTFRDGVLALVQQNNERGALLAAAATPPQPIYDEAKERELFEVWALEEIGPYFNKHEDCLVRTDHGGYVYGQTVTSWQAWLACAQSRAKAGEDV